MATTIVSRGIVTVTHMIYCGGCEKRMPADEVPIRRYSIWGIPVWYRYCDQCWGDILEENKSPERGLDNPYRGRVQFTL